MGKNLNVYILISMPIILKRGVGMKNKSYIRIDLCIAAAIILNILICIWII